MNELPWARVLVAGVDSGGGVLLTPRLMITAAHCVAAVSENNLEVIVINRAPVRATIAEVAETADLALLKLDYIVGTLGAMPLAARGRRGDDWFAPSRPSPADPELGGRVHGTLPYDCQAGALIDAVQLTTESSIGDYHGYSGGPVFITPEERRKVIGILIEQYPNLVDPRFASNTLFAAAIEGVIQQFESLSAQYLLQTIWEIIDTADSEDAIDRVDASRDRFELQDSSTREVERLRKPSRAEAVTSWLDGGGLVQPEIRGLHHALVSKWVAQVDTEVE